MTQLLPVGSRRRTKRTAMTNRGEGPVRRARPSAHRLFGRHRDAADELSAEQLQMVVGGSSWETSWCGDMTALLGNESLVQHFLAATGGAPVEIEVELLRDRTPSGFKWSTSSGPPTQILSGTLSQADIILAEQRPISLVLPIFQ